MCNLWRIEISALPRQFFPSSPVHTHPVIHTPLTFRMGGFGIWQYETINLYPVHHRKQSAYILQ